MLKRDDNTIIDFVTHHHIGPINRIQKLSVDPATKKLTYELGHTDISDAIIAVSDQIILDQHTYMPSVLSDIIKCVKLQEGKWWRI